MEIDEQALAFLQSYGYPGNVRELRSIVTAALNLAPDGVITMDCLPCYLSRDAMSRSACSTGSDTVLPLAAVERCHILSAYQQSDFNKAKTARLLGIGLNTLRRKLQSYDKEL